MLEFPRLSHFYVLSTNLLNFPYISIDSLCHRYLHFFKAHHFTILLQHVKIVIVDLLQNKFIEFIMIDHLAARIVVNIQVNSFRSSCLH